MKRIISMLLMLSLMTASWALAEKQQDMENYTRYFDYQPEVNEPLGMIPCTDHSTLVLYFSRVPRAPKHRTAFRLAKGE